jgi:predicted oxidoreductase
VIHNGEIFFMKMYRIPNTDLDVSRIAFGTWHLGGTWDHEPPTPEVRERAPRLIHTALEHGINLIDLADIYTRGKSDALVGDVIRAQPSLRDKMVLQAKCGIILSGDGDPARFDFSYAHLIKALETSLKSLGTDHVEIMLLHRPDPLVEPEEVARALDELHTSGKVRYFGVSNHTPMQIELLKKYVRQPLLINQIELNLLHNHLIQDGVIFNINGGHYVGAGGALDYCRLNDIMIQAWSPVAGGKLFNPPDDAPANVKAAAHEIAVLAEQHNTTKEAIAVAWLLRHPAKIQPIIGTLKPERIVDSVRGDDVELSRVEWYRLFAAANGKPIP